MVIGNGVLVRGDLASRPVQARGARVDRKVAAHVPPGDALLEVGERVVDGAALDARIVAHPLPHHYRRLIEQAGIPDCIEPTAPLMVPDRVRFELGPLALHVRFAAQMNRLGIAALDDERIGDILRDAVSVQLEERVDHRIRGGEAPGRAGRQTQPAGGRRVEAALRRRVRGGPRRRVGSRPLEGRCLRVEGAAAEEQQGDEPGGAPSAGLLAAGPAFGHDPRATNAHFVQRHEEHDPHQHRQRVRGREQRGGHGRDGQGVAAVAGEELRRHEPEGREDHHHERQLHREPDSDQELRREREVSVGGDDGREHLRLKAEQHAQDVRQQPLKRDAGPAQEQHHAHGERGHDQSLLAGVERRREERPELVDHHR